MIRPNIIHNYLFSNNEDKKFETVKMNHKCCGVTYAKSTCGMIVFLGNENYSCVEIPPDNVMEQLHDFAEYIKVSNCNAVSVTFLREKANRTYKETCYINPLNDNAIILETDLIDTGLGISSFSSNISIRELDYSCIAMVHHDILDALGIIY